ncbi:SAM-dependent methyltransferase [Komagataeibacter rhaeticus]|uniref:Class I SAM-dependent methyltransferase n=1 Tax=Komagataeibacter rhaeticus TaxID=215221 RepID=A0A181C7W2_9PROT|nr:class I SAM-dependent methyltransferase [Komagataeibacter rhaeticus]ATU73593.1 class I SAM-dependent methyltransferase [Komagataeibacter xylinus]EGG76277.1 type 11 methyltransferase [Gluconacetobacter sp. SXCC-1]KDU95286.1 methyltransferase type 11 [Komagataeibacter rhaeticus AF1]MBL7240960.1 class I SAM-dependent methyltransferase [Komagataeibacter rhaeticus]PYD53969.1 SAM-dependent methyltransferase [Komagataeibacter rhaeticus]
MNDLHGFHPQSFTAASGESDTAFYSRRPAGPMLDQGAQAAITALYRTLLPEGGDILDLMAGPDSHLPPDMEFGSVIGIGVNAQALDSNTRLTDRVVEDLNETPELPLADESMDAVLLCDVAPYLRQPVALLREAARVLQPGGLIILTSGTRFIPHKATALWQALDETDRRRMLETLLARAGFGPVDNGTVTPAPEDLFWHDAVHAMTARRPDVV